MSEKIIMQTLGEICKGFKLVSSFTESSAFFSLSILFVRIYKILMKQINVSPMLCMLW